MTAGGSRIQGFDGLRAIAFILVFFSHKITFFNAGSYGDAGVWLFFVLSGFLITRILAASRQEIEAGTTTFLEALRRFYLRRSARIFPPYYLLLAIVWCISLFVPVDHFWRPEKLAFLTYTTNILIELRDAWPGHFGHFWTLAIEEQFYVLFAPLVLVLPRRYTLPTCVAIIIIAIATRIYLYLSGATISAQDVNSLVNFGLLALGGIVGLNAHRELPQWLLTGRAQLIALGVIVLSAILFFNQRTLWPLFAKPCIGILAGLLLLQIMQGQRSWFVGLLEKPPLRDLGRISYGAYLIHNLILLGPLFALAGIATDGFGLPWIVATAGEFILTVVIATLSWRYMEKLIMGWAATITARKTPPRHDALTEAMKSKV